MIPFKRWTEDTTTASVVGTGDDNETVVMRKKYDKKNKRKDQLDVLKRFIKKTQKQIDIAVRDVLY